MVLEEYPILRIELGNVAHSINFPRKKEDGFGIWLG
jgi:hypothetical protein